MGKAACPSGKHLKEGREEKTGIPSELLWQAGTQSRTEAWESGLLGWGGIEELKCVDAELSPTLSSRAAGEGGIGWLVSAGLTQPIPPQVLPSLAQVQVVPGL